MASCVKSRTGSQNIPRKGENFSYYQGSVNEDIGMANVCLLIDDQQLNDSLKTRHFLQSITVFFDCREHDELERLVYKVTREPGNLENHLQRIYFCYSNNRSEQLYASLIDLLTILAGKGEALSQRIIYGTRSIINKEQWTALQKYLITLDLTVFPSNRFSVLNPCLLGTTQLLDKDKNTVVQYDYLTLAHDYIEYSQLDSAITVLEQGIPEDPDGKEGQKLLLELYKSTGDVIRFRPMYQSVIKKNLIDEWQQLDDYFNNRTL